MPTPELRPDTNDLIKPPRPPYDPASPMRVLGFWHGALAAREQVMAQARDDYERASHVAAIARIESIIEALQAGGELTGMPEYARWLAYGG